MITILIGLGINARWEVIEGDTKFFDITKKIHNALQGNTERAKKRRRMKSVTSKIEAFNHV